MDSDWHFCWLLLELGTVSLATSLAYILIYVYYLKHGAQVNVANKKGNTPLHEAVHWNFLNVAELLLQHGAIASRQNRDNKQPIHYAQVC